MSTEIKIIRLFCNDRTTCEKNVGYLVGINNIDKEIRLLFRLISDYYDKYTEANSITIDDLKAFYDYQYPMSKDKQFHISLIDEVYGIDISEAVVKDLLEQMVERHFATHIINKLLPVMEGKEYGVLTSIGETINDFTKLMVNPPKSSIELLPNESMLVDLVGELSNDGLDWHIAALNEIVGRIKRKTLGLIYAFVDSGKTSFSLAACACFARQLAETEDVIVYAGNEEAANRVNIRLTEAMLNINRAQILADLEGVERRRREVGFTRIKLFDSIILLEDLKKLLDKYQPHILFVDQATKINIRSSAKDVEKLQILFNAYRELAKEYNCAIIGITQGVGEAENKKWLNLSDVYGSRVAIQGELDYSIGIGRQTDEAAKAHLRYINVPKNKLYNGDGGKITVQFDRETCQWGQI